MPLSVPALAAFATLQFLWVWNDLLVALVFLGGTPDVRVLTLALAPLAFLTLAFGSRHPRAPGAVLRAIGLFLVFGVPLGLLDPVFGAAIGFAAGGAATLRPLEDGPTTKARALAVVALLPYLAVLLTLFPQFGLRSGAVLPLAIHGLVDQAIEERRASR